MKVESIEDVTTLESAQAELLEEGIKEGWFDEAARQRLVVYRVAGGGAATKPLVAPLNPEIKPGSLIVCSGWARVVNRVTLGNADEQDVKLDVAAAVEVDSPD